MRLLILPILALLVVAPFAVCDYKGIPEERIFSLENSKELTTFEAGVADEFYIKIHGNPTTGYSWILEENSDKDNLKALNLNDFGSSENYETDAHPEGMVGVGGDYFFKFKGVKEGSYNLRFIKKRVWEKSPVDEKFVLLNIRAK